MTFLMAAQPQDQTCFAAPGTDVMGQEETSPMRVAPLFTFDASVVNASPRPNDDVSIRPPNRTCRRRACDAARG